MIALLTAAVMVVATAVSAFASPSVAADSVVPVTEGFKATETDGSDIPDQSVAAIVKGINQGTNTIQDLGVDPEEGITGATAISKVVNLYRDPDTESGMVTLQIPGLTSNCTNVRLMFYAYGTWIVNNAESIDYANKTATFFVYTGTHPTIIIADVAGATPTVTPGSSTTGTTSTSTSTTATSPKTGVQSTSTVLFAIAIAAFATAAIITGKRKRA